MFKNHHILDLFDYICTDNMHHYEHTNKIKGVHLAGEPIRKARRMTFAEINERWLETEMSGGVDLPRATFNRHNDAIEDIFGIFIDCDRQNGYKYWLNQKKNE